MKIAIDIGHKSWGDKGATSPCGIAEHPYWASHVAIISDSLIARGHAVKIYRREDYGDSITKECQAINRWGADVAISLHLNSADSPSCQGGHEVVHYDGSICGERLARCIDAQFDAFEDLSDRNIRTPWDGRGDTFLRATKMPAVIVEPAFLSVKSDVAILKTRGDDIAESIARGVHAYCLSYS